MNIIIYNPLANTNKGEQKANELKNTLNEESKLIDIREIKDYGGFFASLAADDKVILCGGDGTLNRFINAVKNIEIKNELYLFPGGNGNDFLNDLGMMGKNEPVKINQYLENLPTVYIDGLEPTLFINGVGYGIDGYCCEEGDRMKENSDEPINYASIAIKGMLGAFKPRNATVTVDGSTKKYKKVWIAPTMFGRYYGGGMIAAPGQDRNKSKDGVTLMVWHGKGKLQTLIVFPSIFKGEHIKHTNMVELIKGHDITVEFDKPTPLQIDGETVHNVTKYRVVAAG